MMRAASFQKHCSLCIFMAWSLLGEIYPASETQTSAGDTKETSQSDSKEKKVYTNSDLERLKTTQPINQDAAKKDNSGKNRSSNSALDNYRDIHGHDREYWQQKLHPLRSKVNLLDSKITDLENKKAGQTVSSGLKVSKSGKLHASSGDPQAKLQQKIDELKLQRSQVTRDIEDLEEKARKDQALPEWLR
jgi:hypothetical protein